MSDDLRTQFDIIDYLIKEDFISDTTKLNDIFKTIIDKNNFVMAVYVIKKGYNKDLINYTLKTAIDKGYSDMARDLIDKDYVNNKKAINDAFIKAVENNNFTMVKFLIKSIDQLYQVDEETIEKAFNISTEYLFKNI